MLKSKENISRTKIVNITDRLQVMLNMTLPRLKKSDRRFFLIE